MKKIIVASMLLLCLCSCGENYSDGQWVGTVTKLSHKGLIFKSWEGQINLGGARTQSDGKHTQIVANTYEFNVSDTSVIRDLNTAMESGSPVRLTYHQWAIPPINIENSHVVVSVEFINQEQPRK